MKITFLRGNKTFHGFDFFHLWFLISRFKWQIALKIQLVRDDNACQPKPNRIEIGWELILYFANFVNSGFSATKLWILLLYVGLAFALTVAGSHSSDKSLSSSSSGLENCSFFCFLVPLDLVCGACSFVVDDCLLLKPDKTHSSVPLFFNREEKQGLFRRKRKKHYRIRFLHIWRSERRLLLMKLRKLIWIRQTRVKLVAKGQ